MRADMFKVIVERPRWGAGHAASVKLKKSRDGDVKCIGLGRHALTQARYTKAFNENLAPLHRFLESRRGCRWDDVFSEICRTLDTGSTVKMHVRMHLDDMVMIRIVRGRDGEWMNDGRVIGARTGRWRWRRFFVDPQDGILKDASALERCLGRGEPRKGGAR